MIATRARWRVVSDSSKSILELKVGEAVGAGDRGNIGFGGRRTGNVAVGGWDAESDDEDGVEEEVAVKGEGRVRGRPDAARAFMTASQPFSSVLIFSLSSAFSLSRANSLSRCSWDGSTDRESSARLIPARSLRFSSSSSATRASRRENCAFRLSREF